MTNQLNTEDTPVADPDAQLAWPSRAAFVLRWSAARARFMASSTWFAGHPASADVLARVITTGPLAWRSLAASRLQRSTRGTLFPTHLDAPAQVALFKTLS